MQMKPLDKEQRTETSLKAYQPPRLQEYGDLRSMTQGITKTSHRDGTSTTYFTPA
jgi:hypothetical protein